jgi:hypothetical protein
VTPVLPAPRPGNARPRVASSLPTLLSIGTTSTVVVKRARIIVGATGKAAHRRSRSPTGRRASEPRSSRRVVACGACRRPTGPSALPLRLLGSSPGKEWERPGTKHELPFGEWVCPSVDPQKPPLRCAQISEARRTCRRILRASPPAVDNEPLLRVLPRTAVLDEHRPNPLPGQPLAQALGGEFVALV